MIAIAGGKGGCGKTTTTLGTARALLDAGIVARAVDLDAGMPNLHRMANVDRDPSLTALLDEDTTAIQRDAHGAQIVPAPRALGDLDVPAALDAIRPQEGVALLDCPAGAGPAATAPLREADAAILVTTGRPESVEDAAKTGRMARSLGVPVLGAVVARTERVSRGIEAELATDRTLAVPNSNDPLADERVRACYGSVAEWIASWLRDRRRQQRTRGQERRSSRPGSAAMQSQDRSPPTDPQHAGTECPNCGGARAARSEGTPPTRRRDRRSPRSPARGDTRSSSRGGGALSDRR